MADSIYTQPSLNYNGNIFEFQTVPKFQMPPASDVRNPQITPEERFLLAVKKSATLLNIDTKLIKHFNI